MTKSDLDPWRIICGILSDIDSYSIQPIVDKAGLNVDWTLSERENYMHKYRIAALIPRICTAYEQLSEEDRLRVSYSVAEELSGFGKVEELNNRLERIGWQMCENSLQPVENDVKKLFFPPKSSHDAYVEIRRIIEYTKSSLTIIDPYIDRTIFKIIGAICNKNIEINILTRNIPIDFIHEKDKYLEQYSRLKIQVRKTKEFHDRFIIIDEKKCWHIGASIKDAGSKAFMISEIEDEWNKKPLLDQFKECWSSTEF
ncbi:phospholipase D-like domain-containing protein [candidate division KSB1 bacterium]